jgi:hypothetical protein
VIKVKPYTLSDGHLHKLGSDGVLRHCLTPIEAFKILKIFHEGWRSLWQQHNNKKNHVNMLWVADYS